MYDNLENTLNFYKDQVDLFVEIGDEHRAQLNQDIVNDILLILNK